jgi:hypothetical protein
MLTGYLTSYKVFYPINGIFSLIIFVIFFDFISGNPYIHKVQYLGGFSIILSIWVYMSFIFTKIFHVVNGEVYWSWMEIMRPIIFLSFVAVLISTYFIALKLGKKNISSTEIVFYPIPLVILYSCFAIPSYLDDGYIQSYWTAITPLFVNLIIGFIYYLAYYQKTSREFTDFLGLGCLCFALFIFGNWLNWIPHWILFWPIDLMVFRISILTVSLTKIPVSFKNALLQFSNVKFVILDVALTLICVFIFLKFLMVVGWMTTCNVFYPIYGLFVIGICSSVVYFILKYPKGTFAILIQIVILSVTWIYSS